MNNTMPRRRSSEVTCYRLLQVHPAAPAEVINAAYWRLIGRAQVSGGTEGTADGLIRRLNRAYKILSDPHSRAAYDRSMGPLLVDGPPHSSADPNGQTAGVDAGPANGVAPQDYYELLGVDPSAESAVIEGAYEVMRAYYGALVADGKAPPEALHTLDRAFTTVHDPAQRKIYDASIAPPVPAAEPKKPRPAKPKKTRVVRPKKVPVAKTVHAPAPKVRRPPKEPAKAARAALAPAAAQLVRWSAADRDGALYTGGLILSAISALCLTIGVAGSSLELNDIGLAKSFPVSFYLGLLLLPLASACLWLTNRKVDGIVLAQLLVLLTVIWLVPYFLEETARFRSSYKNYSAVDWLVRGDGFAPDVVVYHNWPFFPVITSAAMKVTGISPTQLMGLFPFVIQLAYLFPLTYLLRVFRPSGNTWWAGVWFFYLFNWTGQDYFSPQAFAFFLFLSLLALFAHITARNGGVFQTRTMALFLALYGCIVLTHVLTAGIIVAMVAMLTLGRQLKQRSVLVAATVMFIAWQLYGASSFFHFSEDRIEDNILDLQDFFNLNVGSRLAGSPDHILVGRLRMAITLIAGGVALTCFLMRITEREDRRNLFLIRRGADTTWQAITSLRIRNLMYIWQPAPFAVFCFLGLVMVAPLYVYGGEMLIRSLLFSLPAFALLVAGAFAWRTPAIAVVAMFAIVAPLHMVARYGNELYDYVSPAEVQGFNYVSTIGPANVYGAYPAAAFENTSQLDWRYGIKPGKSKPPDFDGYLRPDQHHWRNPDWPIYVALSRGDDAAAHLFYNRDNFIDQLEDEISRRCNFVPVFQNPDFALYRYHKVCDNQAVSGEPGG
jgi:hypothetical protein